MPFHFNGIVVLLIFNFLYPIVRVCTVVALVIRCQRRIAFVVLLRLSPLQIECQLFNRQQRGNALTAAFFNKFLIERLLHRALAQNKHRVIGIVKVAFFNRQKDLAVQLQRLFLRAAFRIFQHFQADFQNFGFCAFALAQRQKVFFLHLARNFVQVVGFLVRQGGYGRHQQHDAQQQCQDSFHRQVPPFFSFLFEITVTVVRHLIALLLVAD